MAQLTKAREGFLIYGLSDPRTQELRYIGRSSSGFKRAKDHWQKKNFREHRDHCHNWVRSVLTAGFLPQIDIIEEFSPSADINNRLNEAERFWIGYWRMIGARLTNQTEGGEGTTGQVSGMKGKKQTQSAKIAMSVSKLGAKNPFFGKTHTPELRAKWSEKRKGPGSPLYGKRGSHCPNFGTKRNEETKAKMSAANKAAWVRRKAHGAA